MRALPLWQPWGHWIMQGVKRKETRPRSISTLVGERIVIHATASEPLAARAKAVKAALDAAIPLPDLDKLPHGALLGTVRVVDMERMTRVFVQWMREHHPHEYALGNYEVGRWAFTLAEPRPFPVPVPWKGSQGVFMVPGDVVRRAELGLGVL